MWRWLTILFLVRSCEATVIGYINWAGGTSGSVPTATVLSNCVVGTAGDWSVSGNITFTNFAQKGLDGTVTIGGNTYSGSESTIGLSLLADQLGLDGVKLVFTPTNWGNVNNGPNTSVTKGSVGGYIRTDMGALNNTNGGTQHDFLFIGAYSANKVTRDYINGFFNTRDDRAPCTGTIWNSIEAIGFAPTAAVSCSSRLQWVWVTEYFEKGGNNKIAFYTNNGTSWVLQGQTNWTQGDNLCYPSAVEFHFHQTGAADAGMHAYYGPVIITDGDWPVLPTQTGSAGSITISGGPISGGTIRTQ